MPQHTGFLRVAVVQQDGNPGGVQENRAKALAFAEQALAQGADVILFHEELLVGYAPDLAQLAEPVDGPTTRAFQALLAEIWDREGVIVADVQPAQALARRAENPWYVGRRPELYV